MSRHLLWDKLGLIIKPNEEIYWLAKWAGASCIIPCTEDIYRVYITGKDIQGRARIGTFLLNIKTLEVSELTKDPIIDLGERGTLDENGTSYPFVIKIKNKYYLYYLGWIKGVHVPWYNGLFLATSDDGINFSKYSKAPVFDRNQDDYLGIGSMFILFDENKYKMWYSRFDSWGKDEKDHKHYYNIKYAESKDAISWERKNNICIDFINRKIDYAIAKPSVLKIDNKFYMWYSYRGEAYKIGFAVSNDGVHWQRHDEFAGINLSDSGWDSEMLCYAYVFRHQENLYMLYNGNEYGSSGLGIATVSIKNFLDLTKKI